MKNFYVFGLQRSGTNYFRFLMKENFFVEVSNGPGTWWHYNKPPYYILQNLPSYVIYKNPYQWLESILFRNRADIVETNINTYDLQSPDGYMINGLNLNRLCKMYCDHTTNWNTNRFKTIRYESLIDDEWLESFFSSVSFERKTKEIVKPSKVFMSKEIDDESLRYYQDMKPTKFNKQEICLINDLIPENIFNTLEYRRF